MNRLEINLSSNPFRDNIMFYAFHGIFILLLILATSFNVYYFVHYRALRSEMRTVLATSQQEISDLDKRAQQIRNIVSKKDIKDISEKSLFANDVILMRKFFWTDLFNKLEEVLPYTVKMQSIRPIFTDKGIEVRVDGLSKDLKSFFEFEKNLQNNANFANMRPENYRKPEGSDLLFSLIFDYRQQGPQYEEIFDDKQKFSGRVSGQEDLFQFSEGEGADKNEEQGIEQPEAERGE